VTKIHFSHETTKKQEIEGRSFELYRDEKGVPHIFSHKVEDTLFGFGYA
jgi:acyl-homoserine lactone acylase PvdQ